MDESDAVTAFERLGLTSYEAKVFIALQRLGSGTARDVAQVTDVPRSQVYSAAESLSERGLASVQQSNPIRYRPVSIEAAKRTLSERFRREQDRAFEYVERVREESDEEQREDIWTIRGQDGTTNRLVSLAREAEERILFGARETAQVPDSVVEVLHEQAAGGLDVTVISENEAVRETFDDPVRRISPPPLLADNDRSGRLLIADDDIVLVSVVGAARGVDDETSLWSSHTTLARVLVQLIEASLGSVQQQNA